MGFRASLNISRQNFFVPTGKRSPFLWSSNLQPSQSQHRLSSPSFYLFICLFVCLFAYFFMINLGTRIS